jgi:hypothetical protein
MLCLFCKAVSDGYLKRFGVLTEDSVPDPLIQCIAFVSGGRHC